MSFAAPSSGEPTASAEQQAVRDRAGLPTVLVAAAGSGKTRVLTWLYTDAHLQEGLPIQQLLAITFTKRAAGELRERIAGVLQGTALGRDPDLTDAWIGTFHGVCARLLREFAHRRGLDPGFAVIDELTAAEHQAQAWEDALQHILDRRGHDAAELLAQVGEPALRGAVLGWWTARRSAGAVHPVLPTPTTGDDEVRAAVRAMHRAVDDLAAAADELRHPTKPSKRLLETLDIAAEVSDAADAIAALVDHPPIGVRDAADATRRLERRTPHGGPPLGKHHPAFIGFLAARDDLARRLGELVAGPRVVTVAELAQAFSVAYEARKRADECLDHDDLELETLELLRGDAAVRAQLADRFARLFVDEFQDTNPRQAELVQLLTGDRSWWSVTPDDGMPAVTVVGDPRQAIYGFRNASVALIRQAASDAPPGAALALSANYRSDEAVLRAIDAAFARLDPEHQRVVAQRAATPLADGTPRVEVLITRDDQADPWDGEALGGQPGEEPGAMLAEARLVAARIAALREQEPQCSVAVLARARRSLVPIADALTALGIDAVQDGAAGFWERLEVADLIAWLRLVRNARDDAALLMVLASPLVGLSVEGLAVAGDFVDAGRDGQRLIALTEAAAAGALCDDDARRLTATASLLDVQRAPGRSVDPCGLLDDVIAATAYDEHLATLQSAARRLANVARLRRLASDEVAAGGDVGSLVDRAASEQQHGLRAPEAALGGSGAVQLMTVHQAKGLEFDTVVVAGLGSQGRVSVPAMLGDEQRLGLRLRPAPGAPPQSLFEHAALVRELAEREQEELRRVVYVALTRARERLLVSGVAKWRKDGSPFGRDVKDSTPVIDWLAPALVPELNGLLELASRGAVVSGDGVGVSVSSASGEVLPVAQRNPRRDALPAHRPAGPPARPVVDRAPAPLTASPMLSYTALSRHAACGLRWYAEDVLRLAPSRRMAPHAAPAAAADHHGGAAEGVASAARTAAARARRRSTSPDQLSLFGAPSAGGLDAASSVDAPSAADAGRLPANVLGTVVHAVLERLPAHADAAQIASDVAAAGVDASVALDAADAARLAALVSSAVASPAWSTLWERGEPLREQPFTIAVGDDGHMLTGIVDAQVVQADGTVLVVDYKTDQVAASVDLERHVAARYALQRAAYALAALRAGAPAVRVVHLFLDGGPDRQAELRVAAADADAIEAELLVATRAVTAGDCGVTPAPDAFVCDGCPARGGLCRWPLSATLRPPGGGEAERAAWDGDPAAIRG